ncbi:MAG: hypothetical protein EB156_01455 [Euryarchaeota archaeon]|nr:hypothetical protein [Euryarchaeota archaeon]NDB93367.1 hypothetical protein [Euryarchaeota archaeon]NDF21736.1 hypothetical protein [Euryarchaeota archaeon]NDF36444.1 hypothetical protein [Euryarchaeota archaeon]NDG21308.1 hypothetical protein [Euryarchaeota archaeon]
MQHALIYAGITFIIALIFGILPIKRKLGQFTENLRFSTSFASGIIIASALLVVIPEGFELANHGDDEHSEEGDHNLAGSVALVLLEVENGDITPSSAIEEIESLLGGHDEEGHEEDHEEDHEEGHEDEHSESLASNITHVIEEVEASEINATQGIQEINELVTAHTHAEDHDEHDHEEGEHEESGLPILGLAVLLGFLVMLLLEASGAGHAVHEEHHRHKDDHGHDHIHHGRSGWTLVIGLSIHALADGLAIGASLAVGDAALSTAVIAAVLIHKAPAAFSLGVFSKHERGTDTDAVRDVLLFSMATPVAIIISSIALADIEHGTLGLIMLFSAGSFLYVATVDALPDLHNPENSKEIILPFVIGIVAILMILIVASQMGWMDHGH